MRQCLRLFFSGASEAEEETQLEKQPTKKTNAKTKPEKRKSVTEKTVKAKKTKKNEQVLSC